MGVKCTMLKHSNGNHTTLESTHLQETNPRIAIRIEGDNEEQMMPDDDELAFPSIDSVSTQVFCITVVHFFLAIIFNLASCQNSHWEIWIFLYPPVVINVVIFSTLFVSVFLHYLNKALKSCGTQINEIKAVNGWVLLIFIVWTLLTPLAFYLGYYEFKCVQELE